MLYVYLKSIDNLSFLLPNLGLHLVLKDKNRFFCSCWIGLEYPGRL